MNPTDKASPAVKRANHHHFWGAVRRASGLEHTRNQARVLVTMPTNGMAAHGDGSPFRLNCEIFDRTGLRPKRKHEMAVIIS